MIVKGMGTLICDETGCWDDGGGSPTPVSGDLNQQPSSGNGSTGSSSSNATNPTTWITSLSSAFSNIFKAVQPLPAGCTQVAGPYGVSTQCLATGQASTLSLNSVASSLGSSSSLLLIGGAVVVFMLMSKKG